MAFPLPSRRWIALVVVCFGMLMNSLDQTIVNVALPTIQRDLHFTQASLAWVIDAYLITFGGALLLAGRLGDLIGRKKVFLTGVTLFTISSALCGAAASQEMLIAARFVQGLGAALSASVILAMIVAEFPDPRERTKAMSAYILVSVGGGSMGLLLGGVLTQVLSWHWIFFINLPIGVATVIAGALLLDENEGLGIAAGVDIGGALLSTGGLMLAIYTIVTSTQYGWGSAHTIGFGVAAVIVLASFFVLESRLANPLIPLRILRARGLASSSLARGVTMVGLYSTLFIGVQLFQRVLHFDAIRTGLAFLPQALAVTVMSLGITAWIVRRLRAKVAALVGLGVLLVGLPLLATSTPGTVYFPQLFFGLLLIGIGAAAVFPPLLTIGLADIPHRDAGLGSGVVNVSQQMSAAIAVAVLGVVSSARTTSLLAHGESAVNALAGGYRTAFIVGVFCVAAAIVVTALLVRSPIAAPAPSAEPSAELIEV
ncbi:MAG TPA: MFS transporter [Acidimicrobiales bacterium]|nr:MFS transporter [Acidimicrobiales bacterium]